MSIVLLGTTSGSCTLQEQAIAGTTTLTLPTTSGTVVATSSAVSAAGQIPFSTDGSTYTPTAQIVSGTAVATTSGSSVVFTGIPNWVKRITLMFGGVSTNGATTPMMVVQIGSGSLVTTGYLSACTTTGNGTSIQSFTNGFAVRGDSNPAAVVSGTTTLSLLNASTNTWVQSGVSAQTVTPYIFSSAGILTLSGTLDRVALVTADTFDAGSINILYE